MSVERRTPQLDALARWAKDLGARYVVQIEVPDGEQSKLAYLAASGRDLLAITPALERAIASAIQADVRQTLTQAGNLRTENTLRAIEGTIKAAVLGRITAGGVDVRLAPLSGAYRVFKAVHRLDPRIAVATGKLLRALRAARFRLVKR